MFFSFEVIYGTFSYCNTDKGIGTQYLVNIFQNIMHFFKLQNPTCARKLNKTPLKKKE